MRLTFRLRKPLRYGAAKS